MGIAAIIAFLLCGVAHWATDVLSHGSLGPLARYALGTGAIGACLGGWCALQAEPVPALTVFWAWMAIAVAEVAGDVVDKCRAMLQEEPETRKDYMLAYVRYLVRYHPTFSLDSLRRFTDAGELKAFLRRAGVPSFRTVANRCQDLMRAEWALKAPADVMEERQRQRRQGRVR